MGDATAGSEISRSMIVFIIVLVVVGGAASYIYESYIYERHLASPQIVGEAQIYCLDGTMKTCTKGVTLRDDAVVCYSDGARESVPFKSIREYKKK